MKQFAAFIKKEFYHVFRDRRTLLIMFGLPVIQILLFGFALTSEVKNIRLLVTDNAKDYNSLQFINKLKASSYFIIRESSLGYSEIETEFRKGEIKSAVVIPADFGHDLLHSGIARIQVIADGSDPNVAKAVINYITAIAAQYQAEMGTGQSLKYAIIPETRMLYNEELNGSLNFVPGVLALVLMLVCTSLTSVAVVREKELGTMEILLVSPFKPVMVLIAKALPYLVLSLANISLVLAVSVYALDVPIKGSLLLLFLESMLFIFTSLALGLVISNLTNSQQAALLISMMGMMMPTMVFTGFLFPNENMPWIFRQISNFVPSRWYFLIVKSIMLKGLGFSYIIRETLILVAMTIGLLSIALLRFKKRLA